MPVIEATTVVDQRKRGRSLEEALERNILHRTWGRVRHLQVEVDAAQTVVRGKTSTYYLKQLVVAAVLEVLDSTPLKMDVVMEIDVDSAAVEVCVQT